jgi:archaellum component FlaC
MAILETVKVGSGSFEILSGVDETNKAILEFIEKTICRYDICADSKTPSFVFNNEEIRKRFLDFKDKKKGNIRYIIELTRDNIDFCKEIMTAVELRHIQGLRGMSRINETEYQYHAVVDDSNSNSILIRSNSKEVINQQQVVFDSLWNKAIPAKERIEEIEHTGMSVQKSEDGLNKEKCDAEETIHNILENINGLEQPMELISQDPNHNKEAQQSKHKKLQLWSNFSGSEYAIRLEGESNFLAATKESPSTQYTDLVEEAAYLEDMMYDWEYTLKHWTSNRYHSDKSSRKDNEGSFQKQASINNSDYHDLGDNKKNFKCHFCKLTFHGQPQRREHEQAWHFNKHSEIKKP